jgi:GDP-L-fucose synthase
VVQARDEDQDSIEVWGTGNASREFLFVRDAAEAIALATDSYDKPAPVNIGTGDEITIRRLAELICELCRYEGQIVWNATRPDGQLRRALDVTRARHEFGFQASTTLEQGLRETITWYQEHHVRSLACEAA